MATQAHCAFCFETLVASFDHRQPLSLRQIEDLWTEFRAGTVKTAAKDPEESESEENSNLTEVGSGESAAGKPAAISRLLNRVGVSGSGSSTPSSRSTRSSTPSSSRSSNNDSSGDATPASSRSSQSSGSSSGPVGQKEQQAKNFPLFVTWNTLSRNGHKNLRGCIGTFEAQELEHGLHSYALTSAFGDTRFQPIPASLLPSLSNHVTLLTDFSTPAKDPMGWTLGKHGIRISFTNHGRRYGATYLPDVAVEQGWTKEEAIVSLMRKAGWNGSSSSWEKTWRDGRGELITYEGKQVGLKYPEWHEFRQWVDERSSEENPLK